MARSQMTDALEGLDEVALKRCLADPDWRIENLYKIKTKDEDVVTFKMNEAQRAFYQRIWYKNVIPKARQRGFSTLVQIIILDRCLFVPGSDCAIIAQSKDDAKKIRDGKIMFAYERLPATIQNMVPITVKNETELKWANGSRMTVSSSTRGGTIDFLHVSEYGLICLKSPEKAREIQEGSLPAAERGIIVIESTVEANFGIFPDMVRRAGSIKQSGKKLSRLDYRLHFASWWDAPEYEVDPALVAVSPQDHAYFDRAETQIGARISPRKRAWYVAKRDNEFGGENEKMWRQYPTTLEEAFQVATDGLWLATQMARARSDRRIGPAPIDPSLPVNSFWDIGTNDDTAIWLHQRFGAMDHFVGYIEGSAEALSFYVRSLNEWAGKNNVAWGAHYLPHDADRRVPGAEVLKTYRDMLEDLGLRNIEIVPRIAETVLGIEQLRQAFSGYRFDEEACKAGLAHLDGFSKVWNDTQGVWVAQIAKNGHQHAADALRQHAQIAHVLRTSGDQSRGWRRTKRGGAMAS